MLIERLDLLYNLCYERRICLYKVGGVFVNIANIHHSTTIDLRTNTTREVHSANYKTTIEMMFSLSHCGYFVGIIETFLNSLNTSYNSFRVFTFICYVLFHRVLALNEHWLRLAKRGSCHFSQSLKAARIATRATWSMSSQNIYRETRRLNLFERRLIQKLDNMF